MTFRFNLKLKRSVNDTYQIPFTVFGLVCIDVCVYACVHACLKCQIKIEKAKKKKVDSSVHLVVIDTTNSKRIQ